MGLEIFEKFPPPFFSVAIVGSFLLIIFVVIVSKFFTFSTVKKKKTKKTKKKVKMESRKIFTKKEFAHDIEDVTKLLKKIKRRNFVKLKDERILSFEKNLDNEFLFNEYPYVSNTSEISRFLYDFYIERSTKKKLVGVVYFGENASKTGGQAHGGAICSIVVHSMRKLIYSNKGKYFSDFRNMKRISSVYLKPITLKEFVKIECTIEEKGDDLLKVTGVLSSLDGKVRYFQCYGNFTKEKVILDETKFVKCPKVVEKEKFKWDEIVQSSKYLEEIEDSFEPIPQDEIYFFPAHFLTYDRATDKTNSLSSYYNHRTYINKDDMKTISFLWFGERSQYIPMKNEGKYFSVDRAAVMSLLDGLACFPVIFSGFHKPVTSNFNCSFENFDLEINRVYMIEVQAKKMREMYLKSVGKYRTQFKIDFKLKSFDGKHVFLNYNTNYIHFRDG